MGGEGEVRWGRRRGQMGEEEKRGEKRGELRKEREIGRVHTFTFEVIAPQELG